MKLNIFIIVIFLSVSLYGQVDINKFSELQRIYFISETNSLTLNSVNPAALSINTDDDGFLFAYDFFETQNQGNSIASFSMGNLGFVYQDLNPSSDLKLSSYSLNISVGGSLLSVGTSNRILHVKTNDKEKSQFTIDAGILFQPLSFLSIGFVANNISNQKIENIKYDQIYTFGTKITFIQNTLDLFVQTDIKKFDEVNENIQASVGFSFIPVNFIELRTWLQGKKDIINEGIITGIFKIENGLIVSASAHFNSDRERSRYNLMLALPLKTIKF